jgi:hypothetical protein
VVEPALLRGVMATTRGLYRAVVLVVGMSLGGTAAADAPRRAPAPQTRTGKPPIAKKVAPAGTTVVATIATDAPAMVTEPAVPVAPATRAPVPTATALMVSYQRIGRELMQLQGFRGTECTLDLWPTFRAIKLDTALATPEARAQTAATLAEIASRIERKRGITIRPECLSNPLAAECS